MRSDCGDIRFKDSDGNILNYSIEPNKCNTNNTKIWVKFPIIPKSLLKPSIFCIKIQIQKSKSIKLLNNLY